MSIEERKQLDKQIDTSLSPLERRVLRLFLQGLDYIEIAKKIEKNPKSVDNALQRVKQKISRMLQESES